MSIELIQELDSFFYNDNEQESISEEVKELIKDIKRQTSKDNEMIGFCPNGSLESYEVLRWAGVPFSATSPLKVEDHFIIDSSIDKIKKESNRLVLPSLDVLKKMTSLELKPIRTFVKQKTNIRLQSAAGIYAYMWRNAVLLVNTTNESIGGFLHGPNKGERSSVALDAGQGQVI